MSDELKKILEQVHDGITTFDFEGKETPCIVIDEKNMMKCYPKLQDNHLL